MCCDLIKNELVLEFSLITFRINLIMLQEITVQSLIEYQFYYTLPKSKKQTFFLSKTAGPYNLICLTKIICSSSQDEAASGIGWGMPPFHLQQRSRQLHQGARH